MKMGTKAKIVATIVCAFALCAALLGCGGSGGEGDDNGNSGDPAATFQGDWVLSGGSADGQEIDQAVIDALEQMGALPYIQFNPDGTLVLSTSGEKVTGTWTAKDATTADVTIQNDPEEVKIVDGELTIEAEGNVLRFKKGEIPASSAAASAADNVAEAEEATTPDAEESATPEA